MGCFSDLSRACSSLILIVINCLLLAGGVLILVASIHAKNSGWLDVVDSYWGGADSVLTALEIVGGVIIGLAVLGSIAACCRWRVGLLLYAFVVVLVLVAFVVVAVFAFGVRGKAEDWAGKSYPADNDEASIKPEFDRAYCYAQGAYICNDMGLSEAAQIFFPAYANSSATSLLGDLKGLNSICDAGLTSIPGFDSVCKACTQAKEFQNFSSVLDWANDKCPRTSNTLLWCGTYLGNSNANITVGTAPYSECRPEFLDLVSSSALTLGIGSLIICAGALLVVIFSCVLRRREREETKYEDATYATPHANAYNNTPQTNAPFYGSQPVQSYDQQYSKV